MADSLKPPGSLDITEGNISENFKRWKRQIEIHLIASGSQNKDKTVRTSIILHCVGSKVIDSYDLYYITNLMTSHHSNITYRSEEKSGVVQFPGKRQNDKRQICAQHKW